MKNAKKWLAVFLIAMLVVTLTVGMTACNKTKVDNESTAFAMSIQNPDGVFNPFFSTSAYDSSIISLTQISMLNTDKKGNLVAGLDQPTVALAFDIDYLNNSLETIPESDQETAAYTDYRILIKNGIKFSDGEPLTIKDVLFNLYVYLDPVFTGSATIYSTDIVGLNAYRTQDLSATEDAAQGFDEGFLTAANNALKELIAWVTLYAGRGVQLNDIDGLDDEWFDGAKDRKYAKAWDSDTEFTSSRGSYVGDIQMTFASLRDKINHIASLYHDELVSDWNNINMEDYQKKAEKGPEYDTGFTEPWQVFLVNDMNNTDVLKRQNGDGSAFSKTEDLDYILETNKAQEQFNDIVSDEVKAMSEGEAKQNAIRDEFIAAQFKTVFGQSVQTNVDSQGVVSYAVTVPDMSYSMFSQVVSYWGTASNVLDELIAEAKTLYFGKSATLDVPNISGIWVEKVKSFTGKQSTKVDKDGKPMPDVTINGEHYVLHIRINEIDPKALMNFSFTVAPMHYYSNEDEIKKFDADWKKWEDAGADPATFNDRIKGVNHFGLLYGNSDFMNNVINDKAKIGKPVGAGSYQPSNDQGQTDVTKVDSTGSSGFFNNNIIFYTRNNYFWTVGADGGSQESSQLQNAKIKTVVYKVVAQDQIINSLKSGEIHFGDPSATQENVKDLTDAGLTVVRTRTAGYGYIGINPRYIPEEQIRMAIMKAMDIDGTMIADYYKGGFAERIYRPMSMTSWAYPESAKESTADRYPLDNSDGYAEILELVRLAGYTNVGGELVNKNGKKLDIKFTIAGGSTDHPAYNCFLNAQRILNSIGFHVQVVTSAQALSDLSAGKLEVWAAAWSSAIDPDMYQVYSLKSQASSTSNWGYKQIKANPRGEDYSYEYDKIEKLSDLIDDARETNDQDLRKTYYEQCLNLVMDLAVELPTYQRYDIAAFNSSVVDESSLPRHGTGNDEIDEVSPYYGLLARIWEVSFAAQG